MLKKVLRQEEQEKQSEHRLVQLEKPKEHKLDVLEKLKVLKQDRLEKQKEHRKDLLHRQEVRNKEQEFVNLVQKLEELPCNRKHLDAIKRIEISNSHDQLTEHNRMVRYFIC